MAKRRRFSAEFKACAAIESLVGDQTLAELSKKRDVHPQHDQQLETTGSRGRARCLFERRRFGLRCVVHRLQNACRSRKLKSLVNRRLEDRHAFRTGLELIRNAFWIFYSSSTPRPRKWTEAAGSGWKMSKPQSVITTWGSLQSGLRTSLRWTRLSRFITACRVQLTPSLN